MKKRTVAQAYAKDICRICGKKARALPGNPIVFDYGREYAHKKCLPYKSNIQGMTILDVNSLRRPGQLPIEGESVLVSIGFSNADLDLSQEDWSTLATYAAWSSCWWRARKSLGDAVSANRWQAEKWHLVFETALAKRGNK